MSLDLTTRYLGLSLKNPLVASACPLTGELDVLRRLEEAGAAAAVMPSLFEEQIQHPQPRQLSDPAPPAFIGSLSYFRELAEYNKGPECWLRHIEQAKKAVSIPVIGSLNAVSMGPWLRYARRIQEAGADALELNLYLLVTDPDTTAEQVESRYLEIVSGVRAIVSIPLAVKLGPHFSALPNMARRLAAAGVNGLVLFNRFLQPEIDVDGLKAVPHLTLSSADELRLPLRWIALLHGRVPLSLAATSGIGSSRDVLRALLAGADVAMIASTLYRHGVPQLRALLDGVQQWLQANGYQSVEQIKGALSHARCPDPAAFERANYTKALSSFTAGSS
jgi:dihydroorotate dehydrogenase (fumarate)